VVAGVVNEPVDEAGRPLQRKRSESIAGAGEKKEEVGES